MKLKEEVDLEWSEEPQEWADTLDKRSDLAGEGRGASMAEQRMIFRE